MTLQIDLQGRSNEKVARIMTGGLTEGSVAAQATVRASEKNIWTGPDIGLHAQLRPKRMNRLDPSRFDSGY
jgi:hypothetical protein